MIRLTAASLLLATACTPTPPTTEATPSRPADAASAAPAAPEPTTLSAYHWSLTTATGADGRRIDALFPRADTPLQLDFGDDRIRVSNGCNQASGHYVLASQAFSVAALASTQMACADTALMDADAAIAQRLRAGGTLALASSPGEANGNSAGPTLTLATPAGDTLVFTGTPSAGTRYGGPGERMFLEVAAQRVPCHHAMIPDDQCLHVREITYDDEGLKTGEGEWEYFYGNIEGYTHQPGVRNVLRLDRYAVAHPPADGTSVAYVLDMVVESETVTP